MKAETKLARIFKDLAQQQEQTESKAAAILSIVKEGKAGTLEKFDELVQAAYTANGWNAAPGRPANGNGDKESVPATVRTYVTAIRTAFRAKLKPAGFKTFYALRQALEGKPARGGRKGKRGARRAEKANGVASIPKPLQPDFRGVVVEEPDEFKLSLFHDLGALYIRLPAAQRPLFRAQLQKVLDQYKGRVSWTAPATEVKKAA